MRVHNCSPTSTTQKQLDRNQELESSFFASSYMQCFGIVTKW
jgi:hypothetical protein